MVLLELFDEWGSAAEEEEEEDSPAADPMDSEEEEEEDSPAAGPIKHGKLSVVGKVARAHRTLLGPGDLERLAPGVARSVPLDLYACVTKIVAMQAMTLHASGGDCRRLLRLVVAALEQIRDAVQDAIDPNANDCTLVLVVDPQRQAPGKIGSSDERVDDALASIASAPASAKADVVTVVLHEYRHVIATHLAAAEDPRWRVAFNASEADLMGGGSGAGSPVTAVFSPDGDAWAVDSNRLTLTMEGGRLFLLDTGRFTDAAFIAGPASSAIAALKPASLRPLLGRHGQACFSVLSLVGGTDWAKLDGVGNAKAAKILVEYVAASAPDPPPFGADVDLTRLVTATANVLKTSEPDEIQRIRHRIERSYARIHLGLVWAADDPSSADVETVVEHRCTGAEAKSAAKERALNKLETLSRDHVGYLASTEISEAAGRGELGSYRTTGLLPNEGITPTVPPVAEKPSGAAFLAEVIDRRQLWVMGIGGGPVKDDLATQCVEALEQYRAGEVVGTPPDQDTTANRAWAQAIVEAVATQHGTEATSCAGRNKVPPSTALFRGVEGVEGAHAAAVKTWWRGDVADAVKHQVTGEPVGPPTLFHVHEGYDDAGCPLYRMSATGALAKLQDPDGILRNVMNMSDCFLAGMTEITRSGMVQPTEAARRDLYEAALSIRRSRRRPGSFVEEMMTGFAMMSFEGAEVRGALLGALDVAVDISDAVRQYTKRVNGCATPSTKRMYFLARFRRGQRLRLFCCTDSAASQIAMRGSWGYSVGFSASLQVQEAHLVMRLFANGPDVDPADDSAAPPPPFAASAYVDQLSGDAAGSQFRANLAAAAGADYIDPCRLKGQLYNRWRERPDSVPAAAAKWCKALYSMTTVGMAADPEAHADAKRRYPKLAASLGARRALGTKAAEADPEAHAAAKRRHPKLAAVLGARRALGPKAAEADPEAHAAATRRYPKVAASIDALRATYSDGSAAYSAGSAAASSRTDKSHTTRAANLPGGIIRALSAPDPDRRDDSKARRRLLACPGCTSKYDVAPSSRSEPDDQPGADGWTSWEVPCQPKRRFKEHLRDSPECATAVRARWVGDGQAGGSAELGAAVAKLVAKWLPPE